MPRWMILAGCLALIVVAISAIGPIEAQSTQAVTAASTLAATAQMGDVVVATAQIGPLPAAPPMTPFYPGDGRRVLRLTPRDSGGVFSIPVGTLIYVLVPRMPLTRLDYDPTILQELFEPPLPPLPEQSGGAAPNLTATPIPDDSTPEPNPSGPAGPQIAPRIAPIAASWRLISIAPGTTPLTLQSIPCPPGQICPMTPILAFHVTIIVEGFVYPYPTTIPPIPPYLYRNPDVYIGTAYLDRTVVVQPGQVLALDLPFLASGEPITLDFDSSVLSPLPGQDLQHPQPGGWLFRMIAPGTTRITVQSTRCLDGSSQCTPSLLFRVTITSNAGSVPGQ